jgi:hypothetical protein
MPTTRRLALAIGLVISTVSLTLAGTTPTLAAALDSADAAGTPATNAVPNPDAPHDGQVAGARYGAGISVDNPTTTRTFKALHDQMRGESVESGIQTIHTNIGTSFNASTSGAQATQSVSPKIEPANPGTTLYTPTMYPSGGSCIEVSTAYFYSNQVVAAWDWCRAIRFVAEVDIDKDFMNTYTKHKNYSVQIIQTDPSDNTWTAYLFNYQSAQWETFFTQNGTSQVGMGEGWDIYELYSELDGSGESYACADLKRKRVESKGIMVGVGGTLVPADPTVASNHWDHPLGDFHCPSLKYQMVDPFEHWKAKG